MEKEHQGKSAKGTSKNGAGASTKSEATVKNGGASKKPAAKKKGDDDGSDLSETSDIEPMEDIEDDEDGEEVKEGNWFINRLYNSFKPINVLENWVNQPNLYLLLD